MKKFYSFLFAAAALVGFAACSTDEGIENVAPEQEGVMEFVASFDETRTTLDGMDVKWCAGDEIDVNGSRFALTAGAGTTSATFTLKDGETPVTAPFIATYPASARISAYDVEGSHYVTCLLESNVGVGTFNDGANIALASSEDNTLAFKNTLAVLKFQVAASCEEITFATDNEVSLVGQYTAGTAYGELNAVANDAPSSFTLTGNFEAGNNYYTTVIPGRYGLTISIDGIEVATKANHIIEKNNIYNLGVLPEPVHEYTVYVTAQPKSDASMWEKFNLYTWVEEGIVAWPGTDITANTKEINGYTYHYYTYPTEYNGQNVNVIVNDGTSKTADINLGTLDKDYYVVYSTTMNEVYTEAPAAGSIEEAPTAVDPKPETVSVYLKTNWGWTDWALYGFGGTQPATIWGSFNSWPGKAKEYDEEIAGVIYKAWDIPAAVIGQTGTQIIISGKENSETKQTKDTPVTFTEGEDVFVEITGWDVSAEKATLTVIANPY